MKILVLIPDAFGGRGGIAKFNQFYLSSLCSYPRTEEVIAFPRKVVDPVGELPQKINYIDPQFPSVFSYVKSVVTTIKQYQSINLIICGHINILPLAYILSIWKNAPIYLVIHGVEAWEPCPNKLSNMLIDKLDGIITVSELTKNRFLTWSQCFDIDSYLLPNTFDMSSFKPGNKSFSLVQRYQLQNRTVILTLGRLESLEQYKGFDEVIDVLPILIEDIPNLTYLISGDGSDRSRLESKVKALGLQEYVVFTGYVPEEEKSDHYRLADAYVMPSQGEGFGIVYLEAMACGIPVVGSKLDGSSEALRGGSLGILVDPKDSEELVSGILAALKYPKGIVPDGLDYFSIENFNKRCHSILDEICKKK